MINLILISLAVAAISFTITITSIFEGLRKLLSKIHQKIDELVHCPWCLGHYIMLVVLLLCKDAVIPLNSSLIISFIINWFSCIAIMGIVHHILLRAYEPVTKMKMLRMKEKLINRNNEN